MTFLNRDLKSIVSNEEDGTRLDKWLTKKFTYHSRNQWQDIIRKGQITVNGNSCRGSKTLRNGDIVNFLIEEFNEPEVNFDYSIIYEDDIMLAVNKPANLPCHPAGIYFRNTLISDISEKINNKIHLINRLDRETSGIVLFAKNADAAKKLSFLFYSKEIVKEYILVVHGNFPKTYHALGYLTDDTESVIRKKRKFISNNEYIQQKSFYDNQQMETAETHFELQKTKNNFSILKVLPATGRLHQIRATACSLGYPVAGDKIYGQDDTIYLRFIEGKLTKDDMKNLILDRQALHAKSLEFIHPITNLQLKLEAPIPHEFDIIE